jgi:uncharacterized protein YjbI with pentapeptide repeats
MADKELLAILRRGVKTWNIWRREQQVGRKNGLDRLDLREAKLSEADLGGADLSWTDLRGADLTMAYLNGADLTMADLSGAHLRWAKLRKVDLSNAKLREADLRGADLHKADLDTTDLGKADLCRADLSGADLDATWLHGAKLRNANLRKARLDGTNLYGVDLTEANLQRAVLINTNLKKACLTGCRVYGLSAWDVRIEEATQTDIVITRDDQPKVTVDNLEVAQFAHLLLTNEKIRDVIDTIGRKGVLLLGRFTEGRLAILERLRDELRRRDFLPMVFNFDKPETKDFTETVRLLAGLSRFVIADITNPRSAPLELQATVPESMVPFVPILERGQKPFAMLQDLRNAHPDRVLDVIRYPSVERLVEVLDAKIVEPAKARSAELLARKAEDLRIIDV